MRCGRPWVSVSGEVGLYYVFSQSPLTMMPEQNLHVDIPSVIDDEGVMVAVLLEFLVLPLQYRDGEIPVPIPPRTCIVRFACSIPKYPAGCSPRRLHGGSPGGG